MTALQRANQIRRERQALHRKVHSLDYAAGRNRAAELLLTVPDCLATLRIDEFLFWIKRMSRRKVREALASRHISELRPVGLLTVRQRSELAEALRAPWGFE